MSSTVLLCKMGFFKQEEENESCNYATLRVWIMNIIYLVYTILIAVYSSKALVDVQKDNLMGIYALNLFQIIAACLAYQR